MRECFQTPCKTIMRTAPPPTLDASADIAGDAMPRVTRKRPKPGERRVQILQALAEMLEQPGAERITTAALAAG
jgi:TetR/AcrR family transcriptional regulator